MGVGKRKAQQFIRNIADREFQQAHEDDMILKCREPGAWRYYIGFKPSERPSPEGAKRLCEGVEGDPQRRKCPLLDACNAFAQNLPPGTADGIWGGKVWIDGVIQTD